MSADIDAAPPAATFADTTDDALLGAVRDFGGVVSADPDRLGLAPFDNRRATVGTLRSAFVSSFALEFVVMLGTALVAVVPQLCGFVPTTFLDVTPVWPKKLAAMEAMGAQGYLKQYYSERGEHRANHARRISGRSGIRYAEAFMREIPVVQDAL